jgi:hypothetical protein
LEAWISGTLGPLRWFLPADHRFPPVPFNAVLFVFWQSMTPLRDNSRPGFRYHLKVHSFRVFTMILAWVLIVAAFYERPDVLTGAQRLLQHGIENLGDVIPPPWGPRIEFIFREIGGLIWLQITLLIVALRLALSSFAAIFRLLGRRS